MPFSKGLYNLGSTSCLTRLTGFVAASIPIHPLRSGSRLTGGAGIYPKVIPRIPGAELDEFIPSSLSIVDQPTGAAGTAGTRAKQYPGPYSGCEYDLPISEHTAHGSLSMQRVPLELVTSLAYMASPLLEDPWNFVAN